MRILYCDRFNASSMARTHVFELLGNLVRLGHEIVSLEYASFHQPPTSEPINRPSPWRRFKGFLYSSRVRKTFKGEVLLSWTLWQEAMVFLSALRILARNTKRFAVIYRRHNLLNSEYLLSRLFRVPLVKEVNGIMTDEAKIAGHAAHLSLWLFGRIERFNMPRADRIIVVTSKLKELLVTEYGVPEEKIVVIWNGANTDLFSPMDTAEARGRLGLSQNGNYVCFVGSLSAWQGVEYFIQAAPIVLAQCPDTRFLVVGDGRMKEQLLNHAKELGVKDRFTFTGFLPYQEVPLYVNAADVCVAPFVMTRNERIGLSPLKICEYLACGKPVVASRIAGLEILEESRAGTLVTPEDPKELADAVVHLLQSPDLRIKMGNNGRGWVVENRSWASVAKKVAQVCQDAVEERKGHQRA